MPAPLPTDGGNELRYLVHLQAVLVRARPAQGKELPSLPTPAWDPDRALTALDVQEINFDLCDGNTLGYARGRTIAINPINPLPHKTRFHELAHVLLGHTSEGEQADNDRTPRACGNAGRIGRPAVPGCARSAGCRVLPWLHSIVVGRGESDSRAFCQRVLKAADQILKAVPIKSKKRRVPSDAR